MKKSLIVLAGVLLFMAACKGPDNPQPAAGKGGNAILHVTPKHHGKQIDSCTIFIKYNAIDVPAGNIYDDSMQCIHVGGIPVATFSGLRAGNYYLYGYGWDSSLTPPQHVKGGFAYQIVSETDQSLDLAISE